MARFKRILLKLSGESLMGKQGHGIDPERLGDYARQIKEVAEMGVQIGIVIGGGNIFRGLSGAKKGFDRVKGDQMGMCATVINSLALSSALDAEDYDPYNPDPHFAYRGNVYGAGCGTDKYDSDNDGVVDTYNPNSGYVWGQTEVNIYGGYISRSVYGAGAMASVGFIDHTRTKKHLYINHETEPSLSWPYELTYGKITDSLNRVYPSGDA